VKGKGMNNEARELDYIKASVVAKRQSVYMLHIRGTNRYKIGITGDINRRLYDLRAARPFETLDLLELVRGGSRRLEQRLHAIFADHSIGG
jgi:hypothetical protein